MPHLPRQNCYYSVGENIAVASTVSFNVFTAELSKCEHSYPLKKMKVPNYSITFTFTVRGFENMTRKT